MALELYIGKGHVGTLEEGRECSIIMFVDVGCECARAQELIRVTQSPIAFQGAISTCSIPGQDLSNDMLALQRTQASLHAKAFCAINTYLHAWLQQLHTFLLGYITFIRAACL